MNRRGLLLVEVLGWLACSLPLIAVAFAVVVSLARHSRTVDGTTLDLACDSLRRDASAGVVVEGDGLAAGGHRWRIEGGRLTRDGRDLLPVTSFAAVPSGRVVVVTITPTAGLPVRRLEVGP